MTEQDKEKYIAEEIFVVKHSGEIPEVTFHESLYYLTEDPEGPGLQLNCDDIPSLKQSAVKRYKVIILRDLDSENRHKSLYRGLARCLVNWQRLLKFCTREKIDFQKIRDEVANAFKEFFNKEIADVQCGRRNSCINCSHKEIEVLIISLGLSVGDLPEGWQELCP